LLCSFFEALGNSCLGIETLLAFSLFLRKQSSKFAVHKSSCLLGSNSKLGGVSGNVREISQFGTCRSAAEASQSGSSTSFCFSSIEDGSVFITAQRSFPFVSLCSFSHVLNFFRGSSCTLSFLRFLSSQHASRKEYCKSRKDCNRVGNYISLKPLEKLFEKFIEQKSE